MSKNLIELKQKAKWVREQIFEMAIRVGHGHITSSFSCVEILVALYQGGILHFDASNPNLKDRDRFILSKGQAGLAIYPVLADLGFFPVSELMNFTQANSMLGCHADNNVPGVETVTGSLGHGLGIAVGLALCAKMDREDYLTITLLGDAECYEGSVWEAAMFAAHHQLNNLVAIIDRNQQGVLGFTEELLRLDPLEEKWKSFGWDVVTIDGHSFEQIFAASKGIRSTTSNKPCVIIANTIKGKGVSFMENQRGWHCRVPSGEQIELARQELNLERSC